MALINCPECGKEVSDQSRECVHCGYPIPNKEQEVQTSAVDQNSTNIQTSKRKNKPVLMSIVGVAVLIFVLILGTNVMDKSKKDSDYLNQQIAKAQAETEILNSLEIQDGWEWNEKDGYSYVTGRVKNNGTSTITYFEVYVDFLDDNNNVLNSDYTNSSMVLNPGDMKEFEIMTEYKEEYKKAQVYVNAVSTK